MKLIVYSSSDRSLSEAKEVTQMFEEGLKYFHLKKSSFEKHEMEEYIKAIPAKYHNRIYLHSNHKLKKVFKLGGLHISRTHRKKKYKTKWQQFKLRRLSGNLSFTRTFNKLSTLSEDKTKYDYVFLSPIYDSISKIGHSGNFGNRSLEKYIGLAKSPVIAIGGVSVDKFDECHQLGFAGVAVLGYIWNNEKLSPLEAFREARDKCDSLS